MDGSKVGRRKRNNKKPEKNNQEAFNWHIHYSHVNVELSATFIARSWKFPQENKNKNCTDSIAICWERNLLNNELFYSRKNSPDHKLNAFQKTWSCRHTEKSISHKIWAQQIYLQHATYFIFENSENELKKE